MFRKKVTKKKTTGELNRSAELRKADAAFSLFIRTRDAQDFGGRAFRCISCNRVLPIEQADAGHFINRQHMALRFSESNVWAQCRKCNRFDEGAITDYRRNLVRKIGETKVVMLEAEKFTTHKMDAFDLHEVCLFYKKKVKEFEHQIK